MGIWKVRSGRLPRRETGLQSKTRLAGSFFNLLQGNQLSLTGTWASLLGELPVFGRFDVPLPERPRPALRRTHRINLAPANRAVEEHAIAVGEFRQRDLSSDRARVQQPNLSDRLVQIRRDRLDFLVLDPDVTGRAGATVAALRAGESETVFVPGGRQSVGNLGLGKINERKKPRCPRLSGTVCPLVFRLIIFEVRQLTP